MLAAEPWQDTAFDGIGGALIGAFITVAAVYLTVRANRIQARETDAVAAAARVAEVSEELRAELKRGSVQDQAGVQTALTRWLISVRSDGSLLGRHVKEFKLSIQQTKGYGLTALEGAVPSASEQQLQAAQTQLNFLISDLTSWLAEGKKPRSRDVP